MKCVFCVTAFFNFIEIFATKNCSTLNELNELIKRNGPSRTSKKKFRRILLVGVRIIEENARSAGNELLHRLGLSVFI